MMTMMMMKYRTGEVITAAVAHTCAVYIDSLCYTHTQHTAYTMQQKGGVVHT